MHYSKLLLQFLATAGLVSAQSFCSGAQHSGTSVRVTSNKVGDINGIGYELWADGGNNSATFYSDGSFSCSFSNSHDYLCRTGLSFDSTKTHDQIGHMKADFKLVKQNIQNVGYSYVGIYGWTRNPLVEYYIVDNWLSPGRPGDWVGNRKHGDFNIDGAMYTVYENTRYNAPSIDGNTTFKQFFSIRQQARDCGTIDITAHFQQWAKLGMQLGKMHEAKVLGEAGNGNGGVSGTADFPYAKVYIEGQQSNSNGGGNNQQQQQQQQNNGWNQWGQQGQQQQQQQNNGWNQWGQQGQQQQQQQQNNGGSCSANVLKQGYKCCSSGCQVVYTDADGDWGVENNNWCGCGNRNVIGTGTCSAKITSQGYRCCQSGCIIYYEDSDGTWGVENDQWCGCGGGQQQQQNAGGWNQWGGNQGQGQGQGQNTGGWNQWGGNTQGQGQGQNGGWNQGQGQQQQQQQQQQSSYNYNGNLQYKDAPSSYTNSRGQQAGRIVKEGYSGINGYNYLNVYLPYGYTDSKQYNIFYIMHGGGENENTIFGNDVHLDYILDHMIQDKLIEPMIVVTPTFNKCEAGTFYNEFRQSVIPFVEGKYSTYAKSTNQNDIKASRMHRAYGGFSMGGVSTWAVVTHCLDIVGYFMPLSGDSWEGNGNYAKAKGIADAVDKSGLQKNQYFIFVATGSEDIAYPNVQPQVEEMKKMSQFVYTSDFSKGNFYFLVANGKTHWWGYVKHYVYDALPQFFREGQY